VFTSLHIHHSLTGCETRASSLHHFTTPNGAESNREGSRKAWQVSGYSPHGEVWASVQDQWETSRMNHPSGGGPSPTAGR
jgi:hypothetical protein